MNERSQLPASLTMAASRQAFTLICHLSSLIIDAQLKKNEVSQLTLVHHERAVRSKPL